MFGTVMRHAYKILVGKPEDKRQLGTPRSRWNENIRMDLRKIEKEIENWIHMAQDRGQIAGSCEHSNEPAGYLKGGEFFDYLTDC